MISDANLYKTVATVGIASVTAPAAVPAKPIWIHWMQVIGITDWTQASSFFGAILSLLGILALLWRWIGRPLFKRLGWIKSGPKTWAKLTESEMAQLESMR